MNKKPSKKKPSSPTQRSLELMRERGYFCEVVEKWNPFAPTPKTSFRKGIRQDLFGILDIICLGEGEIIGLQVCHRSGVSKRLKKIAEHENTAAVRRAGIKIIVHGWDKEKLREVDCS